MNNWSLLFAVPLTAYTSPSFESAGFSAQYLVLPLAALLGKRYGLTGVIAVAIGGLAFVVELGGLAWGSFGGNPALYLVALAVAALFASDRPLSDWLRWPGTAKAANWLAFAAPFLLVSGIGTGYMEAPRGADLRLGFSFFGASLGYFLLFLMGARGLRAWPVLLGLAAVAALSWGLNAAGLFGAPGPGSSLRAAFRPLQPITAVAALVAFSAGAELGRFLRGQPARGLWSRPYLSAGVLLFAWAGPECIAYAPWTIGSVHGLTLLKAAVLLPLVSFVLGLLRGGRGVLFATAGAPLAVAVAVGINAIAQEAFHWQGRLVGWLPIEAPFVACAYAMLGARIAEARGGKPLAFPALQWLTYVLLVLGTAGAIAGEEGAAWRQWLAVAFLAVAVACAIAWSLLRRAMSGTAYEITPEKWLAFTTLVALALSVAANLQATWESLKGLGLLLLLPLWALFSSDAARRLREFADTSLNMEMLALLAIAGLIYVAGLLQALRSLLASVPKVVADLKKIAAYRKR